MFKKICLFFISIFTVITLIGCTTNVNDMSKLEFINFPQATYLMVEDSNPSKVMEAYYELLENITIAITPKNGGTPVPYTLKSAMASGFVSTNFTQDILTTEGTKSIVITLDQNSKIKLTYVFTVIKSQATLFARGKGTQEEPYEIATPQQFMNIGTRFFGVPVPTDAASDDLWMYYYQFSFPYLAGGKYYKFVNDLDFSGIDYVTLGSLGGMNYIPFTGYIDGQGYKIKNLTVKTFSDSNSLFAGLSGATIKNITFTNIKINARGKYGAALFSQPGHSDGSKYYNFVENVNVESGLIVAERVGALAGEADRTFFKDCTIGTLGNPSSLILQDFLGSNSAGIAGAAISRKYSYKARGIISSGPAVVKPFNYSKIVELSGSTVTTINGIYSEWKQNQASRTLLDKTESITAATITYYNIVFYNCEVYATLFVNSKDRGGVYTDPSSTSDFIFNSDNNALAIMKNSDTSVIKDNLTEPMAVGTYSSLSYSLDGKFADGNYQWRVVYFNTIDMNSGTIDLDALNFIDYVYDIDKKVIDEKYPKFITGESYSISTYYYDANGKILGIYKQVIKSNSYDMTVSLDGRKLTYSSKSI